MATTALDATLGGLTAWLVMTMRPVLVDSEEMFQISDVDRLPPFFMSVVSDADHWMFLSSRGGLTAGRVSSGRCLFPYETDDRLHLSGAHTGPFTELRVGEVVWRPFFGEATTQVRRNLYKSVYGNRVVFEEVHSDLRLTFRYGWASSDQFGWVRTATLIAHDDAPASQLQVTDGLQNIMPDGVQLIAQQTMSNLVNAYKRSELLEGSRLGLYTLEAKMSDRAEPAESLRANVVWSYGLEGAKVRLSLSSSTPVWVGRPGAYILGGQITLGAGERSTWRIVAEVAQSQVQVEALRVRLQAGEDWAAVLEADIAAGTQRLLENVASADGLQLTNEPIVCAHHFANVLFNNMRGGVFADEELVSGPDVAAFVRGRNVEVFNRHQALLQALPASIDYGQVVKRLAAPSDPNLRRLSLEYLPISFSRRHGDPSRPWNRFAIHLRDDEGRHILNYQGNWRDIFQNWEALTCSFPELIESVIAKFVNASTADGHNPYRVTRQGIEWEVPEPDQPWSNIGYWGDHQIVYLLRLLEASARHHPERLQQMLHEPIFSYANVPYRIAPYAQLLEDPRDSVRLDCELDEAIEARVSKLGTDAKLIATADGIQHVTLLEKLLVAALAKLSNLVVDGGIWMNTQRPEWNDANNALAGYGLSMVTLYHLRRYLVFFQNLVEEGGRPDFAMSTEVALWLDGILVVLEQNLPLLKTPSVADADRRRVLDGLGAVYSRYRQKVYAAGLGGSSERRKQDVLRLCRTALTYVDHAIAANVRADGLYHSYNIVHFAEGEAAVEPLYEMLEGQVAALSSGQLDGASTLALVDALFGSRMYREDQKSFMLYPARVLPSFLDKNVIPAEDVMTNPLLVALLTAQDHSVVAVDARGHYRFAPDLENAGHLQGVLTRLEAGRWSDLVRAHRDRTLGLYERVFDHRAFTGRSGTMYAYEGIGSIYWHMVAKLLLAVQEVYLQTPETDPALLRSLALAYYRIRDGLGFSKPAEVYGAFPADPYSHSPGHAGAQQPGMTGQVKEEILTRRGELGVNVEAGRLVFRPRLLRRRELTTSPRSWSFLPLRGEPAKLELGAGSLGFTVCQVPVVYRVDDSAPTLTAVVVTASGERPAPSGALDEATSQAIFARTELIQRIEVSFPSATLTLD